MTQVPREENPEFFGRHRVHAAEGTLDTDQYRAAGELFFTLDPVNDQVLFAKEVEFDGVLDVDGAANFAAEAEFAANVHLQLTLEAGADGVGTDGEQLTSGGAAAECDWSAAGSRREWKHVLATREDAAAVLAMFLQTPVYDFRYKEKSEAENGERIVNTGDTETVYTGILADEAPWAMHFHGRIFNPISAFGHTLLAMQGLAAQVADLKAEIAALQTPAKAPKGVSGETKDAA